MPTGRVGGSGLGLVIRPPDRRGGRGDRDPGGEASGRRLRSGQPQIVAPALAFVCQRRTYPSPILAASLVPSVGVGAPSQSNPSQAHPFPMLIEVIRDGRRPLAFVHAAAG